MGTRNNVRHWIYMVRDAVLDVTTSRKARTQFFAGVWIGVELVLVMTDIHTLRDLALWIVSGWMVGLYCYCISPRLEREESNPLLDVKSARVEVNADGQTVIFAVDADLHTYELRPGNEGYADAVEQILTMQPGLAALFAMVDDE